MTGAERVQKLAAQLMAAIGKAAPVLREDLRAKLPALLPPAVAWPLCLMLAGWYLNKGPDAQSLAVVPALRLAEPIYRFLDLYADILTLMVKTADTARDDIELARAGGYFSVAAARIGPSMLELAVRSGQFQSVSKALSAAIPMPGTAATADKKDLSAQPDKSRARQFDAFGFASSSPDAEISRVNAQEVAYWRNQLARRDLPPYMRWLYEQKMLGVGIPMYDSATDAASAWSAAVAGLADADNSELRSYFRDNLEQLQRSGVLA